MIVLWGPNWAPRNWALCDGQLLAIASNTALFSLIGTIYGGDGRTTFALPDFRGRVPMNQGRGPGLSFYNIGAKGGQEYVTLNQLEMPVHNHSANTSGMSVTLGASTSTATSQTPVAGYSLGAPVNNLTTDPIDAYVSSTPNVPLAGGAVSGTVIIGNSGGSQSHENRMPFQVVSIIMALYGIFPSRN